jgi:hypothetical protein
MTPKAKPGDYGKLPVGVQRGLGINAVFSQRKTALPD